MTGRGARLIELCRRDLPEADYFVLAQGGYVVDQRDRRAPGAAPRPDPRRRPGRGAAPARGAGRAAVGTGRGAGRAAGPAVGRRARRLALPGVDPLRPGVALSGPAYKGFAHADDQTADELLALARKVVPATLATVTQAGLGYVEITAPGVDKGARAGRGRRRTGHHCPTTCASSATCPTTCRCSPGPAGGGSPSPTPTPRSWRWPTRSRRATTPTA